MNINQAGLDLVKEFEGLSLTVYTCPAGLPTIGYGHVLTPSSGGMETITEEEAEDLLRADLRTAEGAVERLIRVPLNENQFSALTSFTFNLGSGALQRSTLRHKLNAGDYDEVPDELLRWCYAGGRRLAGLLRRRTAEAALWATAYRNEDYKPEPHPTPASLPWWQAFSSNLARYP